MLAIGLCGAQGTGKSTLANALAEDFNLPLITECARAVAKDMNIYDLSLLKGDVELGRNFQRNCLLYQLRSEDHNPAGFISDRTTIDVAAYWMKWHAHNATSEDNMTYYKMAINNVKRYDLVVYVRPEFEIVDDGFRSTNKAYQDEMDLLIRMLMYESHAICCAVSGSVRQRVDQVKMALHSLGVL